MFPTTAKAPIARVSVVGGWTESPATWRTAVRSLAPSWIGAPIHAGEQRANQLHACSTRGPWVTHGQCLVFVQGHCESISFGALAVRDVVGDVVGDVVEVSVEDVVGVGITILSLTTFSYVDPL